MDVREVESFLTGEGVVGGHLEVEIEQAQAKIEQKNHNIIRFATHAARLRQMKHGAHERYHAQDGIVIVDTVGNCLVRMESTMALLEAKNESLESTINIATLAQAALDKYGNKIPVIPKNY